MTELTMPKLSDSMEEGTVISWLKAPGERIEVGDELVEIETDKATVTHATVVSGTLEILVPEGTTVPVGAPIARLTASVATRTERPEPAPRSETGPCSRLLLPLSEPRRPAPGRTPHEPVHVGGPKVRATPLARRAAEVHGLALADIDGTGPLGRITRADVLHRADVALDPRPPLPRRRTGPAPPSVAASSVTARPLARAVGPHMAGVSERGDTRQELSRLQQVVARRMAEANATIPHFQVQTEVAMDAAIALRAEVKKLVGDGEAVPSLNDVIVKAAAVALREHPLANGSYKDGTFELHATINIGIAVAAAGALVVPTVSDAGTKSLAQIARETRRLAKRVRSGEITPPELAGATFTVSNLGMYGMTAITPVINPPQAAILGVGATGTTLARDPETGDIVDRQLLTLTLSCDHRILYGAEAARFLARIRQLLERPLLLAL